jgi:nucleoside-diphosphate-sugar epimerase
VSRVLVTGGAGFIGSALVKKLLADGSQVNVLDDMSRGRYSRIRALGSAVSVFSGDVRDPELVKAAARGCGTIAHLAYLQGTQTFYSEPRQVLDVAVRGMSNVLAACESEGVGDLLLVSSSEAYQVATTVPTPETVPLSIPDPLNPRYSYGGGKALCEIMANAWQLSGVLDRVIIARPHNIIGPDMGHEHVIPQFADRMKEMFTRSMNPYDVLKFPIQGTGQETRSFCYIDDCVEQLALLLRSASEGTSVYHVGQMDERSITDVAHAVADCFGRSIKVVPGSLPKGSPPRRCPDTTKVSMLANGDLPVPVGFWEAIRRTVEWYQGHE